jgi:hypothetical protein
VLLFIFACGKDTDDCPSPVVEPPRIEWLTPKDGGAVTAGNVEASIVVDHFMLVDPAKHNDGEPTGFVEISLDGTKLKNVGETTFSVSIPKGPHELTAKLFYEDGDAVTATADRVCSEDETDPDCVEVASTISVTAKLGG